MHNRSITLKHSLPCCLQVRQLSASAVIPAGPQLVVHHDTWSAYPAYKIQLQTFKHTCNLVDYVYSGLWLSCNHSVDIYLSVIKQGCGTGHYIELHVRLSNQHEQVYLLYSCAFIHRRIYPT